MTGNKNAWRAPLAGLASVAMLATMGVAASTAGAVTYEGDDVRQTPSFKVTYEAGSRGSASWKEATSQKDADNGVHAAGDYIVDSPAVTPNAGYEFTGWYTEPTGGERVQFDSSSATASAVRKDEDNSVSAVKQDVTYYAHYASSTAEGDLVKATFSDQQGKANVPAQVVELAAGDKLASWQVPTDKAAEGQILDVDAAWTAPVNKDVYFNLTYTPGVVVTFNNDGYDGWTAAKNGNPDGDEKYETKVGGTIDAAPVAHKASTVVTSWQVRGGSAYVPGSTTFSTNADVDASTSTESYKVNYVVNQDAMINRMAKDTAAPVKDADAASLASTYVGAAPASTYVAANAAVPTPTDQVDTYDGLYEVAGWYYYSHQDGNDHLYDGKTTAAVLEKANNAASGDHEFTLVAVLVPAASQEYTVKFDEGYGNGKVSEVKVAKGQAVAVPAAPVRDGYRFLGWYTTADVAYNFNAPVNGSFTLTAKWLLAAKYDLNYLLGLNNSSKTFTKNSWEKFEKARMAVAKASEGSIRGTNTPVTLDPKDDSDLNDNSYAVADWDNDYLTDAKVAEITETLQAAFAKLQYVGETAKDVFTDVDAHTPHLRNINNLYFQGVIKGFQAADGTYYFGGMQEIKRQDFAAFMYRLAGEPAFDEAKATKTFTDVTAGDSANHSKAVLWAASNGIIGGFPDGTFRGLDKIKRQDAAAMLYKLVKGQNIDPTFDPSHEPQFADVDSTTPWYKETMFLAKYGVIQGFPNNTFGGTKTIVRQDAAAFLDRTQNSLGVNIELLYK